YPSVKDDADAQKKEFTEKLDLIKSLGLNTAIVQVRPKSDALYESDINPWSDVLTGTQDKYPGYDPLEFMVEEAHSRGLELHAWLNPYRITTSGTELSALSEDHPARLNPEWVISYNNAMYYDPANSEVKEYICNTVAEIVDNYDVDAIHFDDYFYPSNYPLPVGEDKDGAVANARRENVNDLIRMVSETIRERSSEVEFGVSPMGIWKNAPASNFGMSIKGNEAYYSVFADAIDWIENEYVDYIVPQIYWEIGHSLADYKTLVRFWADAVSETDVKLYIGEAIYRDEVAVEIDKHIEFCESIENVSGHIFYNCSNLISNRKNCAELIKAEYSDIPEQTTEPETEPVTEPQTEPSVTEPIVTGKTTTALFSDQSVYINGEKTAFDAYNIDGYNYFRLRDLANALKNTGSRFEVGYESDTNTIVLTSGIPYSGEAEASDGAKAQKTALSVSAVIKTNGSSMRIMAYNIDGYNYFKLRDLSDELKFAVTYDEDTRQIGIITPLI
ncbi:MAG: family 10 glycosylhydrolase, partial [Firmicutes bacterium]|nr:family 10 glycosylhydrolase [Bacillota bacterium]